MMLRIGYGLSVAATGAEGATPFFLMLAEGMTFLLLADANSLLRRP